jgi:hypothetical protein
MILSMRSFTFILFLILFITSAYVNCTLYGSIASVPHFGVALSEYGEKERDVFLLMYIAGGRTLPSNDQIREIGFTLVRRAYRKAFIDTIQPDTSIGPYATSETFDLAAASIRILYWIPPLSLAVLLLIILIPRPRPSDEE